MLVAVKLFIVKARQSQKTKSPSVEVHVKSFWRRVPIRSRRCSSSSSLLPDSDDGGEEGGRQSLPSALILIYKLPNELNTSI